MGHRFGGGHQPELRRVRAARDDKAGGAVASDEPAVGGRDVVGVAQHAGTVVHRIADAAGVEVLHEEGHAAERSVGQLAFRVLDRRVEATVDDRVELRVELLDAGDGRFDQLHR